MSKFYITPCCGEPLPESFAAPGEAWRDFIENLPMSGGDETWEDIAKEAGLMDIWPDTEDEVHDALDALHQALDRAGVVCQGHRTESRGMEAPRFYLKKDAE